MRTFHSARGVQMLLCSFAPGSRSPDMSLTPDHTWRKSVITAQAGALRVWFKIQYESYIQGQLSACSGQLSSCTSEPSNNTSLKSTRSGQNKTAGIICSENVFTWYLTYGRHWILMWNMGYIISHIHKGEIWCCSSLTAVISQASPGLRRWNVWPLQTAEQLKQLADPSASFLKQPLRGHGCKKNVRIGELKRPGKSVTCTPIRS